MQSNPEDTTFLGGRHTPSGKKMERGKQQKQNLHMPLCRERHYNRAATIPPFGEKQPGGSEKRDVIYTCFLYLSSSLVVHYLHIAKRYHCEKHVLQQASYHSSSHFLKPYITHFFLFPKTSGPGKASPRSSGAEGDSNRVSLPVPSSNCTAAATAAMMRRELVVLCVKPGSQK